MSSPTSEPYPVLSPSKKCQEMWLNCVEPQPAVKCLVNIVMAMVYLDSQPDFASADGLRYTLK